MMAKKSKTLEKSAKSKVHTRYRNTANKIVPSVTTIIGGNLGWNKGVLLGWTKKMMRQGIDPDKVRDAAADVGTLAHSLIEEHITERAPHLETVPVNRDDYSPAHMKLAMNAFQAFLDWAETWEINFESPDVLSEERLVSEWYQFGGTLDFIVPLQGELVLIDFKTSNGLYVEHRIQLAAYQYLYKEHTGLLLGTHLLQFGKEEPTFHHHPFPNLDKEFEAFKHLAALHQLHKELK